MEVQDHSHIKGYPQKLWSLPGALSTHVLLLLRRQQG